MEVSSDEETWGSLRFDSGSKKQIPEKRPNEGVLKSAKKLNIETTPQPHHAVSKDESAKSDQAESDNATLRSSSTTKSEKIDEKLNGKNVTEADKSIASTLPSNGVQGLTSKLKTNLETASSSSTPVASPKSVKVKEIKHSERVVQASINRYKPYFSFMSGNDDSDSSREHFSTKETLRVELEYPKPGVAERFLLLKPVLVNPKTKMPDSDQEDKDEYNPITDLLRTANAIYDYFLSPDLQKLLGDDTEGTMRNLMKHRNRRNGAGFIQAVNEFNAVMRQAKAENKLIGKRVRPSYELVCHILYQVYSRTVAPHAEALNNYQAFSNHVYGEINSILIKEFIERTNITSKSVFIDMGCGIGNVVLQVAAQTACEAHGIEIMETPCKLAKLQLKEYATRMRAWQLPSGNIRIRLGDFLESVEIHDALKRADVILVNNYAFDSSQNQALCQLFLDLKEGTQIISLKSFVPVGHKLNERTAHAPESILRVKKYPYYTEAVSWTHNGGTYYISTVDRGPVQRFYQRMMGQ
ncbi:Nucleosomal histone H3-Lys79 methylase [Umbelopsis sp. WA50703]